MSLKAFTLNNQWSFGVDPKYPLVDLTNIYTHTISKIFYFLCLLLHKPSMHWSEIYFDGHKLLFTLPFIFSLLIGITRLTKKTGYDETKTLLHITFALVNKKNLAGSICRTLDQIRNCFNWKVKKIWLKTHKKLDRFLSIHTCVSSPFFSSSSFFSHSSVALNSDLHCRGLSGQDLFLNLNFFQRLYWLFYWPKAKYFF